MCLTPYRSEVHATPLAFGQGFHILSFLEGKSLSLRTEVSGKVQVNHPLCSIDSGCRRPAAGTVEVLPLRLFLPLWMGGGYCTIRHSLRVCVVRLSLLVSR